MGTGRTRWLVAVLVASWALLMGPPAAGDEAAIHAHRRAEMLEVVQAHARAGYSPALAPAISPAVIAAMGRVARHEFVPEALRASAYQDRPLPIGYGQTISQPYIVALMTDLLEPARGDKVLEVGTGSGYQAAVLAKLVRHVYSMEIIEPLAKQARQRLDRLGYGNVESKLADGYFGWEEHAPYDAIIVTAAASHVPPPLIQQLKPGGRLVIPVGGRFAIQYLLLIEKSEKGEILTKQITAVRFVPLTGDR